MSQRHPDSTGTRAEALSAEERVRVLALGELLMPPSRGMPRVSEVLADGPLLDEAMAKRPEYVPGLREAAGMPAEPGDRDVLASIRAESPGAWAALTVVVPAAYFMDEGVRARLGYRGQVAQPIDLNAPPDYEGLILSVLERGPLCRPTPTLGVLSAERLAKDTPSDRSSSRI